MKFTLLLSLLASASAATKWHELTSDYSFAHYKAEFNKVYGPQENAEREAIFNQRLAHIKSHNSGSATWKTGVNRLTDATDAELNAMKGYDKSSKKHSGGNVFKSASPSVVLPSNLMHRSLSDLPRSVDWRDNGIVTAVKNQGHCGSCWAFATTAVIESHVAKNTGLLFDLSPQQLVSCAPNPKECGGTGGCSGATAEIGMQYIMDAGGFVEEYGYGYSSFYGVESACDMTKKVQVATIEGFHVLPSNDHLALLNAVANGPVAISVDASDWHLYEGGVFDGCNKTSPVIDHAVVLVGYGTDDVYGDYWLVRNSWSPTWGEKGYIRLKRPAPADETCGWDTQVGDGVACKGDTAPEHVCGTCGLLFDSVVPLGAKLTSAFVKPDVPPKLLRH